MQPFHDAIEGNASNPGARLWHFQTTAAAKARMQPCKTCADIKHHWVGEGLLANLWSAKIFQSLNGRLASVNLIKRPVRHRQILSSNLTQTRPYLHHIQLQSEVSVPTLMQTSSPTVYEWPPQLPMVGDAAVNDRDFSVRERTACVTPA